MKIGIVGSRNIRYTDFSKFLSHIPVECTEIISGGAVGVDFLAKIAADYLSIKITEFLPQYDLYGKKAPLIRNHLIVKSSEMVIAFWDMKSKGTLHTINLCQKYSIPCKVISINEIT
ncbi:MAG: hypothetical protein RSC41_01135 [Oscillospiraceae bacterium]